MQNLIDMTDKELLEGCRNEAKTLGSSYSVFYDEIVRRDQNRHTKAIEKLTKWAVILAGASTLAAIASAIAAVIAITKG